MCAKPLKFLVVLVAMIQTIIAGLFLHGYVWTVVAGFYLSNLKKLL